MTTEERLAAEQKERLEAAKNTSIVSPIQRASIVIFRRLLTGRLARDRADVS